MGDWQNGLLGCFNNCGLCIKGYFCPCIVHGNNAEGALGASCCIQTCCFFIPVCNCLQFVKVRAATREMSGIDGGCIGDCLTTAICAPCALIQISQELEYASATRQGMDRE
eukprot:GHVT01069509.1.p2 GENE.GHVT01069509.1~~GHVT01069509.1.p2  ORF type:complete len:111 (+),score=3.96 GHVT01069509.1:77-409(+)